MLVLQTGLFGSVLLNRKSKSPLFPGLGAVVTKLKCINIKHLTDKWLLFVWISYRRVNIHSAVKTVNNTHAIKPLTEPL